MSPAEFEVARAAAAGQNELVLYRLDQVEESVKETKQVVRDGIQSINDRFDRYLESREKTCPLNKDVHGLEDQWGASKTEIKKVNKRVDSIETKVNKSSNKLAWIFGLGVGGFTLLQVLYYTGVFAALL